MTVKQADRLLKDAGSRWRLLSVLKDEDTHWLVLRAYTINGGSPKLWIQFESTEVADAHIWGELDMNAAGRALRDLLVPILERDKVKNGCAAK